MKKLGIAFLADLGKPVDPGVIDVLDEFARNLPCKHLGTFGPTSSASDILLAFHRLAEAVRTKPVTYPDGVQGLEGGDEMLAAQTYLVQRAILELPAAARTNLLAALESKEGHAACTYIASESGLGGAATVDFNVVSYAAMFLQEQAGRPMAYPGSLDATPDLSKFSPLARCAFNVDHVIAGFTIQADAD